MEVIKIKRGDPYNFYLTDNVFHPHGINRFTLYWSDDNRNSLSPADYLHKMHESGINSLRMVVPGEFEHGVEPELGKYNPSFLEPVDYVFELANELDIYIILCLFDYASFWVPWEEDIWNYGIYSTKFSNPKDFFGSSELRKYEKGRLKFLVEHFKKYENLFAWEPMNEMNYLGRFFGNDCEQVTMAWFDDMTQEIREVDNKHLITGSLWGGETWESLYSQPSNDIIQVHTYDETRSPEGIAENIRGYIRKLKKFNKPIIVGEFASEENNPERNEFVKEALTAARECNSSAWLYCSTWDEFGDMDEDLFNVFKETRPD